MSTLTYDFHSTVFVFLVAVWTVILNIDVTSVLTLMTTPSQFMLGIGDCFYKSSALRANKKTVLICFCG